MRIFITGATGFVGQNLVAFLKQQVPESTLFCLARDPQKLEALTGERVIPVPGDILEPQSYREVAQQADVVFHIAAKVSLKNGPEFYPINTDGTRYLLQVLQDASGLQRLVYVSSIAAFDHDFAEPIPLRILTELSSPMPSTDYGKSKRQAEELILQSGLPYTILRPSYIYGPYPRVGSSVDRLIQDILRQKRYTRFPFPGRVSEIYVEDLVAAMWRASLAPAALNEDFFISNAEPIAISDALQVLANALQVPLQLDVYTLEQIQRVQRWLYQVHPGNPVFRIFFEDYFVCSAQKLYQTIGYAPRHSFEEAIHKTLSWYRAHGLI